MKNIIVAILLFLVAIAAFGQDPPVIVDSEGQSAPAILVNSTPDGDIYMAATDLQRIRLRVCAMHGLVICQPDWFPDAAFVVKLEMASYKKPLDGNNSNFIMVQEAIDTSNDTMVTLQAMGYDSEGKQTFYHDHRKTALADAGSTDPDYLGDAAKEQIVLQICSLLAKQGKDVQSQTKLDSLIAASNDPSFAPKSN
jgi:hypothetical protein